MTATSFTPSPAALDLLAAYAELDADAPFIPTRKGRALFLELEKAGLVERQAVLHDAVWKGLGRRFTITAAGRAWFNLSQETPL